MTTWMMKNGIRGAVVAVLVVAASGCSSGAANSTAAGVAEPAAQTAGARSPGDELRARFVGNWELVSYVSFPAQGGEVDNNYIGRIVYDEHGNMSAVGMSRTLPERARNGEASSGANSRAGFGYFSTWEIFPDEARIVHHVIGSPTNPAWPNTDLTRYYEFLPNGNLTLSIRDASGRVTGTLTWRKLTAAATDQIR